MYFLLAILVHAAISTAAAMAIAPRAVDPAATGAALWTLGMISALLSAIGFGATAWYLSRRIKLFSGAQVGLLCGFVCSFILGLSMGQMQFSLVLYLALLVPTLIGVLLASLLDRPGSGWQS